MRRGTPRFQIAARESDGLHSLFQVPTLRELEQAARRRGDRPAANRLAALAKARRQRTDAIHFPLPCR